MRRRIRTAAMSDKHMQTRAQTAGRTRTDLAGREYRNSRSHSEFSLDWEDTTARYNQPRVGTVVCRIGPGQSYAIRQVTSDKRAAGLAPHSASSSSCDVSKTGSPSTTLNDLHQGLLQARLPRQDRLGATGESRRQMCSHPYSAN